MKLHISCFYNALLEYYPVHQVWRETKFTKYREHKKVCWLLANYVVNQQLP